MEAATASEHARAVARAAIQAGLTDRDTARQMYQDYTQYLAQGTRGTFTQLLLSRGVIDQAGFARLQASVPVDGSYGGMSSGLGLSASGEMPRRPTGRLGAPSGGEHQALTSRATPYPAMARPTPSPPPQDPSRPFSNSLSAESQLELASDAEAEREAAFFSQQAAEAAQAAPAPELKVGDVLEGYKLVGVLGKGGMGVIYKVEKGGAFFALKTLLSPETADAGFNQNRERFQVEVDALRRLDHPNIVKVHTFGRHGIADWYVMDLVDGQELKDMLADPTLKAHKRLGLFEDVCKAVHHAHQRGVIHRDLKPANIVVTSGGEVKVLDFGLAKLADEELGLTNTGAALGTPYYMAPEQFLDPKSVDFRADIWALGVILYELMADQRPFVGKSFGEMGNKIINDPVVPPSKHKPKVGRDLDLICLRALEKDPERRHEDVETLRLDVAKYRRGNRSAGAMDAVPDEARRFFEKNMVGVIAGVVLASVFYIPLLLFVWAFL